MKEGDRLARGIYGYAQGETGRLIRLDHARAILLRASSETLFDNALPDSAIADYFNRMAAPMVSPHAVTATLFYAQEDAVHQSYSDKTIKDRHVLLWQSESDSLEGFWKATEAVSHLLDYLKFDRYDKRFFETVTINEQMAHNRSRSWISRITGGLTGHGVGFQSIFTTKEETSEARSESRETKVKLHGWEPSAILLNILQQKLDLPSPEALQDMSSSLFFNGKAIDGSIWAEYRKLSVAESIILSMGSRILEKMEPELYAKTHNPKNSRRVPHMLYDTEENNERQLDAIRALRFALDNGYTTDALEMIHKRYPPKVPPGDGDWLFHIALYAAMMRGARMGIDRLLQNEYAPESTEILKLYFSADVKERVGERVDENDLPLNFRGYPGGVFKKENKTTIIPDLLQNGAMPVPCNEAMSVWFRSRNHYHTAEGGDQPAEYPLANTPNYRRANMLQPDDIQMSNYGYDPVNINYRQLAYRLKDMGLLAATPELCAEHVHQLKNTTNYNADQELSAFTQTLKEDVDSRDLSMIWEMEPRWAAIRARDETRKQQTPSVSGYPESTFAQKSSIREEEDIQINARITRMDRRGKDHLPDQEEILVYREDWRNQVEDVLNNEILMLGKSGVTPYKPVVMDPTIAENPAIQNASISFRDGIQSRETGFTASSYGDLKIQMACEALSHIHKVPGGAEGERLVGERLKRISDSVSDRVYGRCAVDGPPSAADLQSIERQVSVALESGLKGAGVRFEPVFSEVKKNIISELRSAISPMTRSNDVKAG